MNKKVAYYIGCAANYNDHGVGKATVEVLRQNGVQVVFPDQKCCGLPHFANGNLKAARRLAEFNVKSLLGHGCDVVTACTSCALALKVEYPRLLATKESEEVARRSHDVTEYLCQLYEQGRLKSDFKPVNSSFVYHVPCHLKVLGGELIKRRLKLIRLIPGTKIELLDRGCCGMAGTFGLKSAYYTTSMEIGRNLFHAIKERRPDQVLTDCPGCTIQIAHGSGCQVSHPVQLLQKSYLGY